MLPKSTSTVIYCLKSSFALTSRLFQHHRPCFLILVPVEGEFSLEMIIKALFFSTFNLKTSRFFISHSPRFFNLLLSVWTFDIGNTIPCLNIYREIFIYSMHTCTVRFKYLCFFEASVCVFKLLFD